MTEEEVVLSAMKLINNCRFDHRVRPALLVVRQEDIVDLAFDLIAVKKSIRRSISDHVHELHKNRT
jgi:hypothetical protein